jgi:hypothetical protein
MACRAIFPQHSLSIGSLDLLLIEIHAPNIFAKTILKTTIKKQILICWTSWSSFFPTYLAILMHFFMVKKRFGIDLVRAWHFIRTKTSRKKKVPRFNFSFEFVSNASIQTQRRSTSRGENPTGPIESRADARKGQNSFERQSHAFYGQEKFSLYSIHKAVIV